MRMHSTDKIAVALLDTCHIGDCRKVMRRLIETGLRVQMCVTSPPYWGLRDYGVRPSVWDGDPACTHAWGEWQEQHDERETKTTGKTRTTDRCYGEQSRRFDGNHQKHFAGASCPICGAWNGCLGLEPTPDLYVAHLVEIFGLVRDVLADDGTLWLNLGDCYATGAGKVGGSPGGGDQGARWAGYRGGHGKVNSGKAAYRLPDQPMGPMTQPNRLPLPGLKPKDLVGIPWRVAFALQADGFYLRSDIIWSKPNPMPESVRDRPAKAHEYIFLLSKSPRYFYDAEAIKELAQPDTLPRYLRGRSDHHKWADGGPGNQTLARSLDQMAVKMSQQLSPAPEIRDDRKALHGPTYSRHRFSIPGDQALSEPTGTRNRRSVWSIGSEPFADAHFATLYLYPMSIQKQFDTLWSLWAKGRAVGNAQRFPRQAPRCAAGALSTNPQRGRIWAPPCSLITPGVLKPVGKRMAYGGSRSF